MFKMISVSYIILGLCGFAFAGDNQFTFTLYDAPSSIPHSPNNSVAFDTLVRSFLENSTYEFSSFPEGYHSYFDSPTAVVYQLEGTKELKGFYFPRGVQTIFSHTYSTASYDLYAPIRQYFLSGNHVGFTPAAATYGGFKQFYDYKLKCFVYGNDKPTTLSVLFVAGSVEVPKTLTTVATYNYNGVVFKKKETVDPKTTTVASNTTAAPTTVASNTTAAPTTVASNTTAAPTTVASNVTAAPTATAASNTTS